MADTMIDKVKIGDSVYSLPSGSSAIVNGDNLIIQNRAGGRDMKHKSGSFVSAPDENGRVTVEVGFKPDFLKVTLPFSNGDTYAVYDSVMFKDKTYWWIPMENSTRYYTIPDTGNGETGIVEITDTGFVFRSHAENTRNVSCTYEAIMFVPVESGGSKHSYSLEEHVVGTWIDGKPVYEKFIEMEGSIPNQGTLPVYRTDLNAEQIIKATVLRVGPSPAVDYACVWTDPDNTIHYKCIDYFSAQSGCSYYMILQYTKTTD